MQRKEEKKTNLFSLEGKNAVVTGCATGIGQGLAVGLAKAGAKILAFDIADLSETKQKVEEVGGECQLYHVDLSNSAMIDEVWHLAVEENQHIDILFNNAGMQHRESVMTYPEDVFDRVIAVNLKSAFLMAQKAANHFKERGCRGKIINTASLFSTFGGVDVSDYLDVVTEPGREADVAAALLAGWADAPCCCVVDLHSIRHASPLREARER